MPAKQPIPSWLYALIAVLALAPIVGIVLIGKYLVPKWYSAAKATAAMGKEDSIQYRGQRVQLSKAYGDFDEYKNDPNNIATGETERVQQLVEGAPIAKEYPTREAMIVAVRGIGVSGGGGRMVGGSPQGGGGGVVGFFI